MKRFFKSAAFPILLVIVLAFVAQRVISPDTGPEPPTYNQFLQQVEKGQVSEVNIKTKDNTLEVTESKAAPGEESGQKFDTGYPPGTEQSLLNQLDQNDVAVTVEGSGGGGIIFGRLGAADFAAGGICHEQKN